MRTYTLIFSLRETGCNVDGKEYVPDNQLKEEIKSDCFLSARKQLLKKYPNAYNIFSKKLF